MIALGWLGERSVVTKTFTGMEHEQLTLALEADTPKRDADLLRLSGYVPHAVLHPLLCVTCVSSTRG